MPVAFHVLPVFALPADALLGFPTLRSLRVDIYPKGGYLTFRIHQCLAKPNSRSLLWRVSHPSSRPDSHSFLASQPFTVHSDTREFPQQPCVADSSAHIRSSSSLASCLRAAPTVNVILNTCSILEPHSVVMVPVRFSGISQDTDILILSEVRYWSQD